MVGAIAMVGAMAVTVYLMRNRVPLSPRQARRQNRWTAPFVAVVLLVLAGVNWRNGQHAVAEFVAVIALVSLAFALVDVLRTWSAVEEQQNFAVEPGKCGRCGYDLTGNESGVCPECGWEITDRKFDFEVACAIEPGAITFSNIRGV